MTNHHQSEHRHGPQLVNDTGSTRTVYISRRDQDTWARVIAFCQAHNLSLSRFIADALRWYIDRVMDTEPTA